METPTPKKIQRTDILVVDDQLENLSLLADMLKAKGFGVRPVLSGETAIRAAEQQCPDLVLLDIDMPDMNGYSVCEALKSNPQLNKVPVIFVSALNDTASKVKAFSNGGVDYITKPFQIDEVNARIETHLRLQQLQSSLSTQNRELARKNNELHQLREVRDNLTSMIVHDLRSPLSGIYGYLELLELGGADQLDSNGKQFVQKAIQGCRKASDLIDSLVDITRLEQAEMPLECRRANIKQLVHDAAANVENQLEQKSINFDYPEQPLRVLCDTSLMRRVITNLLLNAIDFTEPGEQIRVTVDWINDRVRVAVHDNGPGIPQEFHNKIFLKFTQLASDSERRRRVGGLGLAFCRLAVECQSGAIGVQSEPGHGSSFWFELPAAPNHSQTHHRQRTQ